MQAKAALASAATQAALASAATQAALESAATQATGDMDEPLHLTFSSPDPENFQEAGWRGL